MVQAALSVCVCMCGQLFVQKIPSFQYYTLIFFSLEYFYTGILNMFIPYSYQIYSLKEKLRCPILPFSPNRSWHCGADACQVLNNTLDQGQTNERVLLSNRI